MNKVCVPERVSGFGVSGDRRSFRREAPPAGGGLRLAASFLALVVSNGVIAGSRDCSAMTGGRANESAVSMHSAHAVPALDFEVVARYPHDRTAFTQGLAFYQGKLYESTGLYGHSGVRKLDISSGRVEQSIALPKALFGEGLAVLNDRLLQLTWQSGSGFVYAPADLRKTGSFSYPGEGWGSTVLDTHLVISDGSARLRFLDPLDYRITATLQVTASGRPVEGLNELETVNGSIFANVYPTDCIAQIDAHTGEVLGWMNLEGLLPLFERADGSAVTNGIAYDAKTGHLFVTGKLWPYIYRLRLLDKQAATENKLNKLSLFGQGNIPGAATTSGG